MTNIIPKSDVTSSKLLQEIRQLVEKTKTRIAMSINSEMTLLYWHIGSRIQIDILENKRADYGQKIVLSLSKILRKEYGNGFSERNLARMIKLANCFSDFQILSTLSTKLSWSHFVELLPIKDPVAREFYAEMCRLEGWSVRILQEKIHKMFYERTALAKKPEEVIQSTLQQIREEDKVTPDVVLKDPYVLDFLNLPNEHYENELEEAILKEIEKFMLELGTGFSFIARQKRFTIDSDHYYLDLLLYNRRLRRIVALELKRGKFQAAYKGQMELYLRWLDKYERLEGEEAPIGIILCTEKSAHQIELLDLSASGIHVAEYMTELPPAEVFERKIQEIIQVAKHRLALLHSKSEEEMKE
ncbi:MAG: PDDEXK nuclease domain-containing protein [Alphaproteobacteria bacterium]|nr:PDDEXK nuclease domain-containing protein [Alphaproteobacteria bacterium]